MLDSGREELSGEKGGPFLNFKKGGTERKKGETGPKKKKALPSGINSGKIKPSINA